MPPLIVVNNAKEWSINLPGVEVVSARQYLTNPEYGERKNVKLFNLCRSYRYQSVGYYVTLLASARGHKPVPSIATMQDMRSQNMIRFVSDDMDELIQTALSHTKKSEYTLTVYFGRNIEEQYNKLALQLFNLFQAPLLRARFVKNGKWELRGIKPIPLGDIPEDHHDFLIEVATQHFAGKGVSVRKKASMKYDLAILHNPNEELAPSDEKALKKFIKAANNLGLEAELITRDDFGRLAEFDALFIRETTLVNHHTYKFSRRAAIEGLVVIDDPESIVRCGNKVFLAEVMSRHNIAAPKTVLVHRDNVDSIAQELGFPVVLKKPDSAFSQGVVKVKDEAELGKRIVEFLDESELVIAQEFVPTEFDWRIGILDRQPLFACKYMMVKGHWQIYQNKSAGGFDAGDFETMPVEIAPREVVRTALKAANLIGDGFYGVDIKSVGKKCYVMEVNDNPSVDSGVEDAILRDELYRRVMAVFLKRIEMQKARGTYS